MPQNSGRFSNLIITVLISLTVVFFGCNTAEEQANDIAVEAQAVSTATPTQEATATAERLQTEIVLEPLSPISPISPNATPITMTVNTPITPIEPIPGSEETLATARDDLFQKTGVPVDQINLLSMEAIDWDDSSLGCPQEGTMALQVITPGYKIVLETQGQQFIYHTDKTTNVILCSTALPSDNLIRTEAGSEQALANAIKDLSEQLGVLSGEINMVSVEQVDWNDTSLGCPKEGFMYAQVITPGYKFILEAQGQQYEYHTDQGPNVVLCQP